MKIFITRRNGGGIGWEAAEKGTYSLEVTSSGGSSVGGSSLMNLDIIQLASSIRGWYRDVVWNLAR